jgi:hypothetical protein
VFNGKQRGVMRLLIYGRETWLREALGAVDHLYAFTTSQPALVTSFFGGRMNRR